MDGEPQIPGVPAENKSKIKLIRNAKGDPQWEISVVEGTPPEEMERIRNLALREHRALLDELVPRV